MQTLEYCHSNEIVHRDIKPNNIILRDNRLDEPFLVDFGLSFNKSEDDVLRTDTAGELGNRFLRLPELSANSAVKRDPRSDVTFCAAILLFCLTAVVPGLLIDHESMRPHQRGDCLELLARAIDDDGRRRLLYIFDTAFELNPVNRWQSASALREALRVLAEHDGGTVSESGALWAEIEAYRQSCTVRTMRKHEELLRQALEAFSSAFSDIRRRVGLSWMQQGVDIDPKSGTAMTAAALMPVGEPMRGKVNVKISIIGADLVFDVTYAGQTDRLFRTAVASPKYGTALIMALEPVFLRQLAADLHSR